MVQRKSLYRCSVLSPNRTKNPVSWQISHQHCLHSLSEPQPPPASLRFISGAAALLCAVMQRRRERPIQILQLQPSSLKTIIVMSLWTDRLCVYSRNEWNGRAWIFILIIFAYIFSIFQRKPLYIVAWCYVMTTLIMNNNPIFKYGHLSSQKVTGGQKQPQ